MSSILELSLPATEPILVDTARQWLKRPPTDPDVATIIPFCLKAARRAVENWSGLTLANRSFVQYQDGFPFFPYFQSPYAPLFGAAFPFYFGYGPIASYPYPAIGGLQNQMSSPFEVKALKNPVTSITGIDYIGTDGKKHTLKPFTDFVPDFAKGRVTPLPGQRWPVGIQGPNTVAIYFTAGYLPDGTTATAQQESSPGWEPGETVAQYSYLIDPNGNVQMQQTGPSGTTGTGAEPTWSTEAGQTTAETGGTAVWLCLGPVLGAYAGDTAYAGQTVVFDTNNNLQALIVPAVVSQASGTVFASSLGLTTVDNGATAWRCLGLYQAPLPSPPDQPSGYVRTINIPEDLEMAILLMTSHYYFNREAVTAGPAVTIPLGVEAIIQSIREIDFGPIGSV